MIEKKTNICEIYKIYNNFDNKIYIGQTTVGIEKRFYNHKKYSSKGCIKLYNALNAHGRENFFIESIATVKLNSTQIEINDFETLLIEQYNSVVNGYNCKTEGTGGKLSEETKNKISNSKIGTQIGENNPFYGKCHTEESKKKMSNSLKGREVWNKGIPLSDEDRANFVSPMKKQKRKCLKIEKVKKISEESLKKNKETRLKNKIIKQMKFFYSSTIYYNFEPTSEK